MKLTTAAPCGAAFYYVEEEGKAVLMRQMKIMTGRMKGKSWKCVSFNKIDRFMVKCRCWENGGFSGCPVSGGGLFTKNDMNGFILWMLCCASWSLGADIFVSPDGDDAHAGTEEFPMRSVEAAVRKAGQGHYGKGCQIILADGIYHLEEPLLLRPVHSGLTIRAKNPHKAVLSGAQPFVADWKPFRDGIMRTSVPSGLEMDVLLVNGKPMHMARYPNVTPGERIFQGTARTRTIRNG